MSYRRNADTKLRELERRYKETGSAENFARYAQERARVGLSSLYEEVEHILFSHRIDPGFINYQNINIHQSEEQFQHLLKIQGDDPNYQVENTFLAFEVERNLNPQVAPSTPKPPATPDELEAEYDALSEMFNARGWPTLLDRLHMPFSDEDHDGSGYSARDSISYFLEASRGNFDFRSLPSHQAITDLFSPEELDKRFKRTLDGYELERAAEYEEILHQELDRARLNRKLYVVNPDLLQKTGDIKRRPPNGGKLLANHLGRYETFLHFVLVEFPPSKHKHSPKYVTWHYNIQQKGYAGGNYDMKYEHAVEDYLRRILKVR